MKGASQFQQDPAKKGEGGTYFPKHEQGTQPQQKQRYRESKVMCQSKDRKVSSVEQRSVYLKRRGGKQTPSIMASEIGGRTPTSWAEPDDLETT